MENKSLSQEEIENFLNLSGWDLIDQLTENFVQNFENDLPDMTITTGSSNYEIVKLGDQYAVLHRDRILASEVSVFLLLRRFNRFANLHKEKYTCKFQ